jgi:hypothetical protein
MFQDNLIRGSEPHRLRESLEQLEPTRAGYHVFRGQILRRLGKEKEAATFAHFVAERWPGADHDEAVELWKAVSAEHRPENDPLSDVAPIDSLRLDGHIATLECGDKDRQPSVTLTRNGNPSSSI